VLGIQCPCFIRVSEKEEHQENNRLNSTLNRPVFREVQSTELGMSIRVFVASMLLLLRESGFPLIASNVVFIQNKYCSYSTGNLRNASKAYLLYSLPSSISIFCVR
jgi:hypothetical protein